MSIDDIIKMLLDNGFTNGWALLGSELSLWEHEQDPPAPLTRPKATDETPSPD
jgi:hypothetical protein